MKVFKLLSFSVISFIICLSCARLKTPEAVAERQNWIESFKDSIQYYRNVSDNIDRELADCNNKVAKLMENFEYVSNPRQVTGFYILKGWKSRIPFSTTSIYARINESEKIELIATLAGGTFNAISVSAPSGSVTSGIVPHDQALNYRHETFTTVCFIGEKADTVAQFIANHKADRLEMAFLESGKKKTFMIPEDQKSMIAETWMLFEQQLRQKELQKQLWITSRKIEACRRMLENSDSLHNL